jgi:tape measure domain-containing protein
MADLNFKATLNLASDAFRKNSQAAKDQFVADQKGMAAATDQVNSKLSQIRATVNGAFNGTGVAALSQQISDVGRNATASGAGVASIKSQIDGVSQTSQTAAANIGGLSNSFKGLAVSAVGVASIVAALKGITDATVELQRTQNALAAVAGGTLLASEALSFINKTATELGLRATSLTKDFTQLSAATRGTALEGAQTEKLFYSVSAAAATLGLGAAETSRAFTALTQTVSKGVVSQEELRGQLSEAIPGAVQIAARAFNVTTEQLGKMVEAGIPATEFVRKFSEQLSKEFPDASKNAATLGGSINLLANQFR